MVYSARYWITDGLSSLHVSQSISRVIGSDRLNNVRSSCLCILYRRRTVISSLSVQYFPYNKQI